MPSSNELAVFYRINPATAAKGINVLAALGLTGVLAALAVVLLAGGRATIRRVTI